jgi:hypothetical protein
MPVKRKSGSHIEYTRPNIFSTSPFSFAFFNRIAWISSTISTNSNTILKSILMSSNALSVLNYSPYSRPRCPPTVLVRRKKMPSSTPSRDILQHIVNGLLDVAILGVRLQNRLHEPGFAYTLDFVPQRIMRPIVHGMGLDVRGVCDAIHDGTPIFYFVHPPI